jgi:hypothetical protein
MKKIFCLLALAASFYISRAQTEEIVGEESKGNVGFGIGLGYGGFGLRLNGLPDDHFAVFVGLGYNLDKAGFNLGGAIRLTPDKRVVPTLIAMYGYNSVIVIKGADQYNKTYYGPSFGGGIEIHSKNGQNFLNLELIFPVRPQAFHDDLKSLQSNPFITGLNEPPPVTLGIGYHLKF